MNIEYNAQQITDATLKNMIKGEESRMLRLKSIFGPSARELDLEHRHRLLEKSVCKLEMRSGALLEYIFQLVREDLRDYENARRASSITGSDEMDRMRKYWTRAKRKLMVLCHLDLRQEVLAFIKKEKLPRRILDKKP